MSPREENEAQRVGQTALATLEVPGWDELSAEERLFAYHLSRAALAGRGLFWRQRHPRAMEIRHLVHGLARAADDLPASVREPVLDWVKSIYVNNGLHQDRTKRKLMPPFSREALLAAARSAKIEPPPFAQERSSLDAWLGSLEAVVFDPELEPLLVVKDPAPGQDMLRDSAVNFYQDVTLAEVEVWRQAGGERHPLNARVSRREGEIIEEIWRAGDADRGIAPGLYAEDIERIIAHLTVALDHAPPEMRRALELLVRFYRSGDLDDWKRFNIAWVRADDGPVDVIHGFIEVYLDPRGQKGAFEGLVYVTDAKTNRLLEALAANAQHFEDRAPFEPAWKRQQMTVPVARAVNVVMACGDGGPQSAIGVNLPNDNRVRAEYGSKSVTLINVLQAYLEASLAAAIDEFVPSNEREAARRYDAEIQVLQTSMHEVLGHASGKVPETLAGEPVDHLRETYNTLEEARAELLALFHGQDPLLLEIGALSDAAAAEESLRAYPRFALMQLRRIKQGDRIEDDHMRAAWMITQWLMRAKGVVAFVNEDGNTYARVTDLDGMRAGIAELTREIQRIKATGDYDAAKMLVDEYAIHFDPALRDEVVARAARAGVPDFYAAVMPRMVPVVGADGVLVDVALGEPEPFLDQMLRFDRAEQEWP